MHTAATESHKHLVHHARLAAGVDGRAAALAIGRLLAAGPATHKVHALQLGGPGPLAGSLEGRVASSGWRVRPTTHICASEEPHRSRAVHPSAGCCPALPVHMTPIRCSIHKQQRHPPHRPWTCWPAAAWAGAATRVQAPLARWFPRFPAPLRPPPPPVNHCRRLTHLRRLPLPRRQCWRPRPAARRCCPAPLRCQCRQRRLARCLPPAAACSCPSCLPPQAQIEEGSLGPAAPACAALRRRRHASSWAGWHQR